jgi:hypothetical protein
MVTWHRRCWPCMVEGVFGGRLSAGGARVRRGAAGDPRPVRRPRLSADRHAADDRPSRRRRHSAAAAQATAVRGFGRLAPLGHLDLANDSFGVQPRRAGTFTEDELRTARRRLRQRTVGDQLPDRNDMRGSWSGVMLRTVLSSSSYSSATMARKKTSIFTATLAEAPASK